MKSCHIFILVLAVLSSQMVAEGCFIGLALGASILGRLTSFFNTMQQVDIIYVEGPPLYYYIDNNGQIVYLTGNEQIIQPGQAIQQPGIAPPQQQTGQVIVAPDGTLYLNGIPIGYRVGNQLRIIY